jgi:uncharacterized protein YbaP (TraB family)
MFKALAAALLLAFAPLCAAAENAPTVTVAHPLLWEINDGTAQVYLFGSIHVMKPDTIWLSDDLKRRFASADQAWFEVADLDDQTTVQQQAQKYMLDPSNHMTEGLTPEEITRLDTLLAPYGLSSARLMGYRKWAVALVLNVQQIAAAGYNPKTGVDLTLMQSARADGKPVHGFETIDEEMQKLTPASDAEDMAALRATLKDADSATKDIAALFNAWATGDEKQLTYFMVDKMKAEEPSLYHRVIVERDAAWTPQVEQLIRDLKAKGGGTAFVTVGVGHLVGSDSLIMMLKKDGVIARPVR